MTEGDNMRWVTGLAQTTSVSQGFGHGMRPKRQEHLHHQKTGTWHEPVVNVAVHDRRPANPRVAPVKELLQLLPVLAAPGL